MGDVGFASGQRHGPARRRAAERPSSGPAPLPGRQPLDAFLALEEAIKTVPIPGSPPRLPWVGSSVGLAYLDGALRQNHIRRVWDTLTLVEHGVAQRTVRVDVSLSLLTEGQYRSGIDYSALRAVERGGSHLQGAGGTDLVWVPIARLSRRTVSPVEVRDAHGDNVPRLTQEETGRLMAPAMYRLLRAILRSTPEATDEGSYLHRFLHWDDEARWVVQRALIALTTEKANPHASHVRRRTPGTVDGVGAERRKLALRVVTDNRALLADYFRLLGIVLHDYVVVVGLPASKDEHSLTYRSSLEARFPERTIGGWISRAARQVVASRTSYDVGYTSPLPSGVRSYHLVAETEPGLHIDRLYLTTNVDEVNATDLARDLRYLSERLQQEREEPAGDGLRKALELELQTALRGLSELVRRRTWEAGQIGFAAAGNVPPTCAKAHEIVALGEAVADDEGRSRGSYLDHPSVTPGFLSTLADEIEDFDLGVDLSAENDPAGSLAHAYWRRPSDPRRATLQTTTVTCYLRVVDATMARPRTIALFVAAVFFLKLLVATLLFGVDVPWRWQDAPRGGYQADALVAVLLLVPGFLYSRLELPSANTVAGHLRAWVRGLAYVVIGSSVLVAIAVATGLTAGALLGIVGVALVVDGLCVLGLAFGLGRRRRARLGTPTYALPRWSSGDGEQGVDVPNVVFTGVGVREE